MSAREDADELKLGGAVAVNNALAARVRELVRDCSAIATSQTARKTQSVQRKWLRHVETLDLVQDALNMEKGK